MATKIKLAENEDDNAYLDVQFWEDDCLTVVVSLKKPVDLREAMDRAKREMEHMLYYEPKR